MKYINTYKIFESRVSRNERIELYRDDKIVVVVPLTQKALQKYATGCSWCINSDVREWEDYHEGKSILIIQRNRINNEIGITGNTKSEELYWLTKLYKNESSWSDIIDEIDYDKKLDNNWRDYYKKLSSDINNFDISVVFYNGINLFDCGNNELSEFNKTIHDIPNLNNDIINIIDQFLKRSSKSIQKSITDLK